MFSINICITSCLITTSQA